MSEDAELFAHLYELEGPAGLRRADAQFTLAMWDGSAQRPGARARPARRTRALLPGDARRRPVRVRDQGAARRPRRSRRGRRDRGLALPDVPHGARAAHAVQGDLEAGGGIDRDVRRVGKRRRRTVLGPLVGSGRGGRRRELLRRPRAQAARRRRGAAHGAVGPDRGAGQRRQRLERQRVDHRTQDQGGGRQPRPAAAYVHRRAQAVRGRGQIQRPHVRQAGRGSHRLRRTTKA